MNNDPAEVERMTCGVLIDHEFWVSNLYTSELV